jgi:two-component system phosphate regulon sensor histidine kinase PhoR
MELDGGTNAETGWTILYGAGSGPSDRLTNAIEAALERGQRERERYAFFSTIGHELRTPLTSIRGYLETLLEDDLDPKTAHRFLEVARNEALRLGRLVDGMFDISMLDLRAGPFHAESSVLQTSIAAAICAVAPFAAERGTSIGQLAFAYAEVAVSSDRLTQILVNILENAIKHGRDGGRVFISAVPLDGRYIEVRVDDDGPGIEPQERENVFALGRRGSTARGPGSGIGLAIVRLMIERIGGEVDVAQSSSLGGARFRIRLPIEVRPQTQTGT